MQTPMILTIKTAIAQARFETARRLCIAALAGHPEPTAATEINRCLHDALRTLGDLRGAVGVLAGLETTDPAENAKLQLTQADDWHRLAEYGFYRDSDESRAGLSGDEYAEKMEKLASACFAKALGLLETAPKRQELLALAADTMRRCGRAAEADKLSPKPALPEPAVMPAATTPTASISGRILLPEGQPAAGVCVTLGLQVAMREQDPATYLSPDMHYLPHIGDQQVLTATTDAQGAFRIPGVPAGRHEFLAVTLNPEAFDIHTRFLAHNIQVADAAAVDLGTLTATEWTSAAPLANAPAPETVTLNGTLYRCASALPLRNPFHYPFPRQWLTLALPPGVPANPARLLVLCRCSGPDAGTPVPFQCLATEVGFFAELPPLSTRAYDLYVADAAPATPALPPLSDLTLQPDSDSQTATIDTGRAAFRLPYGTGTDPLAPLLAVKGEDGVWRGTGRLRLPDSVRIAQRRTEILTQGPLCLRVRVAYTLSDGTDYSVTFTAYRDEAYLLAREVSPPLAGAAFEFSLAEFSGGCGFLHWTPEHGNMHWSNLARTDRELARLQESVAWWIPPQGFGYAMTAGNLESHDYIGVFTARRGEWVDREFDRLTRGPVDQDGSLNYELDWPYPEMVGSTISMITARTSAAGDAFFNFGFFDGERQWGILVSTLDRNDGLHKEISGAQHKNSSPRLQEFKDWHLDEADHVTRPHVVAHREQLCKLRRKRQEPAFSPTWERIRSGKTPGAATGLAAILDGDPRLLWRKKKELAGVAHIRSRMTLYGRDFADMYSPVGARAITPWAEEYDLIAASGVFTPEEERLTRAFLMLMGHLYMAPDLMNWQYGSRNCNFEADRTDVVGSVGLAFHGNPDAALMLRHVTGLMERSINTYCTPGSGKWYENPACYYLQASKCRCNLVFHLATHGVYDVTSFPRFKDFLRWGLLLLTPPTPHAYADMRDGLSANAWTAAEKVRRLPPVGDHAHIGPWVPDHYALMAKLYRKSDPAFADELLWGYQAGGADGGYFGNQPLMFTSLSEADLKPAPRSELSSRQLPGFGAVLRGNVGQANEFYLLLKQGPGGYRYHRTEGSFILFADGKPLVYDGGEAGETWRHSTLSFYDTRMPLAPGHVERFFSAGEALEFVQGVHPLALKPGEPTFMSDLCEHQLVPKAWQRYREPNPANMRTILRVGQDYILVHDDLCLPADVPTHWHLQVVAQGETGNSRDGWRFRGRFGTDLQVLLPDQAFTAEAVEQVRTLEYKNPTEAFAMRHLQVDATSPAGFLAVLRPLPAGAKPLTAQLLRCHGRICGVRITGKGIDDTVLLGRHDFEYSAPEQGLSFNGRYGAVLRRGKRQVLGLLAGSSLSAGGITLTTTGTAAVAEIAGKQCQVTTGSTGSFNLTTPVGMKVLAVKRG